MPKRRLQNLGASRANACLQATAAASGMPDRNVDGIPAFRADYVSAADLITSLATLREVVCDGIPVVVRSLGNSKDIRPLFAA